MSARRAFIKAGLGSLAASALPATPARPAPAEAPTLRSSAASNGLLYGAAMGTRELADAPFREAFALECGILVPDLALKWDVLRPSPDRFDFTDADALAQFAARNGMSMRGHALVWHNALPGWFSPVDVKRTKAEAVLVDHIATVCARYSGRLHSWDVVNEAIFLGDRLPNGLRSSPWYVALGPEYIPLAYRAAAAADPAARLVYNEFGLELSDVASERKREAVLRLLDSLRTSGARVDALGIQAHLVGTRTDFDAAKMVGFIRSVAALGMKVMISELDVRDQDLPADIGKRDRQVAAVYAAFLETVLSEQAVIAVLSWGLSDRYTWLRTRGARLDRLPVRPLPLDEQMRRKLAWNAIASALSTAPPRR